MGHVIFSQYFGWVSRIYAHVRGWVMNFWTTTFPNAPAHPPLYLLTGPLLMLYHLGYELGLNFTVQFYKEFNWKLLL